MRASVMTSLLICGLTTAAAAEPANLSLAHARFQPRYLASVVDQPAQEPALVAPPTREASRGHGTTIFGLPKNMGPIDRVARAAIGSTLLGLGIYGLSSSGHFSDTTSGILIGVSAIPFATAATGYCPLYQLFGVDYSF